MNADRARRLARAAWLGLIAWQVVWLALLPTPHGKANPWLAALLTLPLLVPLRGILALRPRSLIWGGYLALFLAMFGMMEWWASPAERPAASLQIVLCGGFLVALALGTRKHRD